MNRPVMSNEIEMKLWLKPSKKKSPGLDGITGEFYKALKTS